MSDLNYLKEYHRITESFIALLLISEGLNDIGKTLYEGYNKQYIDLYHRRLLELQEYGGYTDEQMTSVFPSYDPVALREAITKSTLDRACKLTW